MTRIEAIESALSSVEVSVLKLVAEKAGVDVELAFVVLAALEGFDSSSVRNLVGTCSEVERWLVEGAR